LVFTKINVGVFFGLGLLSALACYTPIFRRPMGWLVALGGFPPLLLMRQDLGQHWARVYAAQACVAVVASGAVAYAFRGERRLRLAEWCQLGAGCAAVAAIVIGVLLITGTSIPAMIENLVAHPARLA